MKRIPLEQARPGMILAQKLVREDGVLLAQKGAELSEPILRMLERLNFETVPIEVESTETPEERQARVALEGEKLQARFSRVESDPILTALKAALVERAARGRLMREKAETKKQVKRIKNLPTVPGIVQKISKMVENPDTTPAEGGPVDFPGIRCCPPKCWRMANSALFRHVPARFRPLPRP